MLNYIPIYGVDKDNRHEDGEGFDNIYAFGS
jgi:hypothetical protein